MTVEILIEVFLFALALSMDAFSVSVTEGLTFSDINKRKGLFIALVFGVFQGLFPLISYWLVELITLALGTAFGTTVGDILSLIVTWVSFILLMFIGTKMLVESIIELTKKEEDKQPKKFSIKTVLIMGVATSIDAFASGVVFHNQNNEGYSISNNYTIWLHISIIIVTTFVLSLLGVYFGKFFRKLFRGKIEITGIIGGVILILLAVWVVLSHYFGL